MKHAVVLLNYRGWQDTNVCISSIKKTKNTPHIIVVDNDSPDESVKKIKSKHPDVKVIESKINLGFSGGNNLGIKFALNKGAEVVHILNNDTEVDKDAFDVSYKFNKNKNQICGGKIYYAKGYEFHKKQKNKGNILWYAGGHFDFNNSVAVHDGVDQVDKGQYDNVREVDFITGCYMAVPSRVFEKVGLLEEKYFLYLEDADFTLKCLNNNISAKYNPEIKIYHRNSSTTVSGSPLVDYYITRNRFLIAKRFGSVRLNLALFKEALTRNFNSKIKRAAFFDFLLNNFGNQNDKIKRLSN